MAREPKPMQFGPPLPGGQVDGPDSRDIPLGHYGKRGPPGAFYVLNGFEVRRGFPRTERGRTVYNATAIRASTAVIAGATWIRGDGTTKRYAVCDGGIWQESTTAGTFTTTAPINIVTARGTIQSISSGTQLNGTDTKWLVDVEVGDLIWLTTGDLIASAGTVSSITDDTTVILSATYAGTDTSGAYSVWRPVDGTNVSLAFVDERMWIADGTNRLYWYGPSESGGSTYVYRKAGLPAPNVDTTTGTLGASGALTAGDYEWWVAWEDEWGNVSNSVSLGHRTATATQKASLTGFPTEPDWAKYYRIYRTTMGGSVGYHITKDIYLSGTVAGSVFTLTTGEPNLGASAHVNRRIKIDGTDYRITANTTTSITVSGTPTTGAVAGFVHGGYTIANADTIGDYSRDVDLDTDNEAPTDNVEPPAGLRDITIIDGGGRWAAITQDKEARVYFSGRATDAPYQGIDDGRDHGRGEFDYAPEYQDCGAQSDPAQRIFELHDVTYCVKRNSLWQLQTSVDDVLFWRWRRVAKGVGCLAPQSLAIHDNVAWWLGQDGEQVDVIRFDGQQLRGTFREASRATGGMPRLRATLDEMTYLTGACGTIYKGRYYLCYAEGANTVNSKTLRYDLKTRACDTQAWGLRFFMAPYLNTTTQAATLLGGGTSADGKLYQVEGAVTDLDAAMTRDIQTGDVVLPLHVEGTMVEVWFEIVVE